MKVLFLLRNGCGSITWEVPEPSRHEFIFASCVLNVRVNGFFQSETLHIKYDEIAVMIYDAGTGLPEMVMPVGMVMQ